MSLRTARAGAAVFFLLFLVFVTWPGMTPFNRIHPLVFGLPFSMFWIALWVFLSFLVLVAVDRVEERGIDAGGKPGNPGSGRGYLQEGEGDE
jgi:hypothetical protein